MAEFLTTRNVSSSIIDIIRQADQEICLVCPYIRFADQVAERLSDADRDGKDILVVYGKEDLRDDTRGVLSGLQNLHLFYSENLHAKCYFNEHELVLTSMNLYAFSEMNNREMGIRAGADEAIYDDALDEVKSIVQNAKKQSLREQAPKKSSGLDLKEMFGLDGASDDTFISELPDGESEKGFCIRCGDRIPHNPGRPFCKGCFKAWNRWENEDYEEE